MLINIIKALPLFPSLWLHMLNKNLIRFKDITFDPKINQIIKNDCTIKLTYSESRILKLLLTSPNKTFSKDDLFTYVWNGTASNIGVVPQTISVLRKKLHNNDIYIIETIKNKGYKADTYGTSFGQKKLNQSHYIFSLLILVIFCLSLVFFEKQMRNTQNETTPSLELLMPNVFQVSDSLPFIFDPTVLKENMTYYINRQTESLNISACHQINNKCDLVYNKIIFLQNGNFDSIITKYIDEINFTNTLYKKDINSNQGRFNTASQVLVDSETEKDYRGQVIANYSLKKSANNNSYSYNKASIVIDETGYRGQCTLTRKNTDHPLECREEDCVNYFGSISDPKKDYAYRKLFQQATSGLNIHLFPVSSDVSLFYNRESQLSYLVYQY
jgi:DNA-binding winged helix-turn-helix (wHTH) protein